MTKPNPVGAALWCAVFCIVFLWAPLAYWAWNASREAVVVELPKPDDSFDNHEYLIDRELTVKAIEACGLKVAP